MSTKCSLVYVKTDFFEFHLYDDFAKTPGLFVRVNNADVTIPISKEELEDIFGQLKKDVDELKQNSDK